MTPGNNGGLEQAAILAGGNGTHLHQGLGKLSNPLIDICGEPLLGRQIELLKWHGLTHSMLLVNYGARDIRGGPA